MGVKISRRHHSPIPAFPRKGGRSLDLGCVDAHSHINLAHSVSMPQKPWGESLCRLRHFCRADTVSFFDGTIDPCAKNHFCARHGHSYLSIEVFLKIPLPPWRLGAAALCVAMTSAHAVFPERPIRFVVPFPPGGSSDTVEIGRAHV